ncbi:MAG: Bro-N domain-containing protein, partial [Okeania sp. SIO2D1]|nr:Bro-N domain-containing protein [Okeania sp. SIO2D1]
GTSDIPEWVARDVVDVLYPLASTNKNYSTYLEKVPSNWKGSRNLATPGGNQDLTTLFEPGLYYLIARSDSPKAISFQKWVFEEVLPSIRRTGGYSVSGSSVDPLLQGRKERLEIIQLGMDLFAQLGGVDERTELQIKDLVRDIVLADRLNRQSLEGSGSKRLEYPISDRLVSLGYGVQPGNVLKSIGQMASNLYKARYGRRPPQREQFVDGTTRMVRLYSEEDLDIVDEAIKRKLGEPPVELLEGDNS